MTNDEVKNFLIQNGAYSDFEIVNIPIFKIYMINNGKIFKKPIIINTLNNININDFINNYLNDISKKWYIYNSGFDKIDITTTVFKCAYVISKDRILKYRKNKINKILNKIYDK